LLLLLLLYVIAIGVYGKVRSLYFLGITPSLNLMVALLISDAFISGNRIPLALYFLPHVCLDAEVSLLI